MEIYLPHLKNKNISYPCITKSKDVTLKHKLLFTIGYGPGLGLLIYLLLVPGNSYLQSGFGSVQDQL